MAGTCSLIVVAVSGGVIVCLRSGRSDAEKSCVTTYLVGKHKKKQTEEGSWGKVPENARQAALKLELIRIASVSFSW